MILNNLLTDPSEIVSRVCTAIDKRQLLLLSYLNQHSFNIYSTNQEYKNIIDKKFTVYQADLGIYLAMKWLTDRKFQRIDATAINEMILTELIKHKISISIVGGNFDDNFIEEESKRRNIELISYHSGFFEDSELENLLFNLMTIKSKVFIIGMGVPKQEFLAEKLSQLNKDKVIICVGNFLEYYFGTKKRSPSLLRKVGLEWLYRLLTEITRLWKRYIFGIPTFLYRILKLRLEL